MNIRRATNAVRSSADARSHNLVLLAVGSLLLSALFFLVSATDAHAAPFQAPEVLYDVVPAAGGTNSMLVTVDTVSGLPSSVGTSTVPGRNGAGNGLAFGNDGTLYNTSGEVTEAFGKPIGLSPDWLELDDSTGIGTLNGVVTFSSGDPFIGRISSMALAPDGTLFGSLNVTQLIPVPPVPPHLLVTIDASGVVTTVGAPTTDGVDIVGEPFSLHIGSYTLDLAAGSFKMKGRMRPEDDRRRRKGRFEYRARAKHTRQRLDIRIDYFGGGMYKIKARGKRVDLGDPVNDILVVLTLGDDFGRQSVEARIRR